MNTLARVFVAATLVVTPLAAQPELGSPLFRRPAAPDSGLEMHLRDLRPVAEKILDAQLAMQPALEGAPAKSAQLAGVARAITAGIRAFVTPALTAGQDVQLVADRWMVAVATLEQQLWIERFLARQVVLGTRSVFLDVRICRTDAATREALGIGKTAQVFDAVGGRKMLEKLRKAGGGVEMLSTPRLAALPLRNVHAAVVNQTSYIRDFEVEIAQGQVIADPVVDVVQDGIVFEGQTAALTDDRIGVFGTVVITDLLKPLPQKTVQIAGGGRPLTIQIPALREFAVPAAVGIAPGGYALLPGPTYEGRQLLVVLHARAVQRN